MPIEGHVVFDTDEKMLYVWDSLQWRACWEGNIAWPLTILTPTASYLANLGITNAQGLIINWGDGTPAQRIPDDVAISATHTYLTAGTYTISFSGTIKPTATITPGSDGTLPHLSAVVTATGKIKFPGTSMLNVFRACVQLTAIPAGLFDGCGAVTTFAGTFRDCTGLLNVPVIFDRCGAVTTFAGTFRGCTALTAVSTIFARNTAVNTFANTFNGCALLNNLPGTLFGGNTAVTTFASCFFGCAALSSVPANLFSTNTLVTTFQSTFEGCRTLNNLPANLFASNTRVTIFIRCFLGCSGLTSIPATLFATNTAVLDFQSVFQQSGITAIPTGLFNTNTLVTGFANSFQQCGSLVTQIPLTLFQNCPAVTTFNSTFIDCINVTGTAPELWLQYPAANSNACFRNDVLLTNYAAIPPAWKNVPHEITLLPE